MNKKLLAVAVAGALTAPVAAFAQSSVTITGKVMASFGQYSVSNRVAGGVGSNSETQVRDESSRILFLMREDLGGGLAAIGKFDLRFGTSDTGVGGNSGESFVGLTSPAWGTLSLGKFDMHYGNHASFTGVHAGLQTNPTSIIDVGGAGGVVYANQTRTNNAIRYGSPKWGNMFEFVLGFSANPTAAGNTPVLTGTAGVGPSSTTVANQNESDLRSTARKGSAWHFQPKIWGKNWEASYSYWTAKPDAAIPVPAAATGLVTAAAAVVKDRGDSLYGWYQWGGLRGGLAWNKSRRDTTTLATGVTVQTTRRTAWGIPVSYTMGNHNFYLDYYRAGGEKVATAAVVAGLDTKARFLGLTYAYDLSKRTTAAVSYAKITNGSGAAYNLFAGNAGLAAGEDPRSIHVTLQHRY